MSKLIVLHDHTSIKGGRQFWEEEVRSGELAWETAQNFIEKRSDPD